MRPRDKGRRVLIDFGAPCPPTRKQLAFIQEIECYIVEEFRGETFEEASAYISRNIDLYEQFKELDESETDPCMFSLEDIYGNND